MTENKFINIDQYIATFSIDVQTVLKQLRVLIHTIAPQATEHISYAMPAFKINEKPLVYFASYKKHIGFYALPTSHHFFKEQLAKYKHGKGSVQFPLEKPMPIPLITKMIKFRIKEITST